MQPAVLLIHLFHIPARFNDGVRVGLGLGVFARTCSFPEPYFAATQSGIIHFICNALFMDKSVQIVRTKHKCGT